MNFSGDTSIRNPEEASVGRNSSNATPVTFAFLKVKRSGGNRKTERQARLGDKNTNEDETNSPNWLPKHEATFKATWVLF